MGLSGYKVLGTGGYGVFGFRGNVGRKVGEPDNKDDNDNNKDNDDDVDMDKDNDDDVDTDKDNDDGSNDNNNDNDS